MPGKRIALSVSWCEKHEKWLYARRKDAKRMAREHPDQHKVAYRCSLKPQLWHIGNINPLVLSGARTRPKIPSR